MKYNFSEKLFMQDFCKDRLQQVRKLVTAGTSFTILGMQNVGMDTFLRYLYMQEWAHFIYHDIVPEENTHEAVFFSLYKDLGGNNPSTTTSSALSACKNQLQTLLLSHKRIVILVSRLDLFQRDFSKGLFTSFKALENIHRGRIIFVFSSIKPFYEMTEAFNKSNPALVSKTLYFTPLKESDLQQILLQNPTPLRENSDEIKRALALSGGHIALLQLLLKTESIMNPLKDNFITLQIQRIYETYSSTQKSQLRKIAAGKPIKDLDPFLLKIGLVKEVDGHYELFTPLLTEYIKKYVQTKLPKKERILFALLKKKLGKLVTKDEIIKAVWKDSDDVSDWAINSLIYRLRKSQTVRSSGFVIENDKGEGYRMIKET